MLNQRTNKSNNLATPRIETHNIPKLELLGGNVIVIIEGMQREPMPVGGGISGLESASTKKSIFLIGLPNRN